MKIFTLCLFLYSAITCAAFKKGNGGNSVVCSNSTELLDFYEGRILYGQHFETLGGDWRTLLDKRLSRLSRYRPIIISDYKKWLINFENEALFIPNVNLGSIDDSQHVIIPEGCRIEQTINQQFDPLSFEKRYYVSKNIWDKLSEHGKAGLVFHELTYRFLAQVDSRKTREITAFIFSIEFQNSTDIEIEKNLGQLVF